MDGAFEYDKNKSRSNRNKHGIDFEQAKEIWSDRFALHVATRYIKDEQRYILIGKWKANIWSVVFTIRNKKVRIISARRARRKEANFYEINHR